MSDMLTHSCVAECSWVYYKTNQSTGIRVETSSVFKNALFTLFYSPSILMQELG